MPSSYEIERVVGSITSAGLAVITAEDAAAQRTAMGVSAGGVSDGTYGDVTVSDDGATFTVDKVDGVTPGALGMALLDDADAAAGRATLGLGTAATAASGDFATAGHNHDGSYLAAQEWPSALLTPVGFVVGNTATTLPIGTTECPAWYMGRAPKAISSVTVRYRFAQGLTGITWAEFFLAKGTPVLGGNPTLTVVGYADASSYGAIALHSLAISVDSGQTLPAGSDWWIGFAKVSTGSPQFRAGLADDLQCGINVDAGNVRPSSILGTPTSFTLAAVNKAIPWLRVQV